MTMRNPIFKDKVFVLALVISVVWHLFCVFAVNIAITPKKAAPIKFSRVSFLGPIAARPAIQARLGPTERSFLEKRHLHKIAAAHITGKDSHIRTVRDGGDHRANEDCDLKLNYLIEDTIGGRKIEPPSVIMD